MAGNYQKQNEQLKGIRYVRANIDKIVAGIDFNDNCVMTGGKDVSFTNGAKVANRKLLLERIIERLILENKNPVVVFYKSPYLINQIMGWYRKNKIRRECNVISSPNLGSDNRCLAPFQGMTSEEIIYTVKAMSVFMNIPFDQYSETFLEYVLNIIEKNEYPLDFENIMILVTKSDEELSRIANYFGLTTESKYFAKSVNGAETAKRVLKELNNYFRSYYQPDFGQKLNICTEVRANNVLFVEIDDQYQTEILEYFCNELKCCAKKCPYILFDDILLKNNPNFEDFLLQSTGLRFCIGAMDVSVVLGNTYLNDFMSQAQTKFLLHYDNASAAESITMCIGYYYHLKVSEEESTNRDAFALLNNGITKGVSVTDEKRLIIDGTDLINLTETQAYLIDSNSGRLLIDGLL